jgi:hypothetical protein
MFNQATLCIKGSNQCLLYPYGAHKYTSYQNSASLNVTDEIHIIAAEFKGQCLCEASPCVISRCRFQIQMLWSKIAVIQRYQSKLLRTITNAPWYVSNQTLHSDLHIPHDGTAFRERTATHHTALD